MICKTIKIANEVFELHPLKALFWRKKEVLILSDIHFGKVNHFRKEGIAIPNIAKEKDYQNLAHLLTFYKPKQLYIIGDLFHSDKNKEWEILRELKAEFNKVNWVLVAGNHDTSTLKLYQDLDIKVRYSLTEKPFYFTHEPEEKEGYYSIAGHIHPGVMLKGAGKQRMRMQCFYFGEKNAILPAFGALTGSFLIEPTYSDSIFVTTGREVIGV